MEKQESQIVDRREASRIATEISQKFTQLVDSLTEEDAELIEELDLSGQASLISITDNLAAIKYGLAARTDSRPQPLDFSSQVFQLEDLNRLRPEVKEAVLNERRRWREWARCEDPGYKEKAHIGDKRFNMDELQRLRTWIDAVIAWHSENPDKRTDSAG